jgi:hypothetical protein
MEVKYGVNSSTRLEGVDDIVEMNRVLEGIRQNTELS